jgi:hypothetical protein
LTEDRNAAAIRRLASDRDAVPDEVVPREFRLAALGGIFISVRKQKEQR